MHWSELITIYLAIGSPFAAARFLNSPGPTRQRASGMILAAVVWPWIVVRWSARTAMGAPSIVDGGGFVNDVSSERADVLQRRIRAAVVALRENQAHVAMNDDRGFDLLAVRLRESLEEYVGLTLLVEARSRGAVTTGHEAEFCRIAGVPAAEQRPAVRCLQRRNAARIERHRSQARRDLVQDLTAIDAWLSRQLTVAPEAHPINQVRSTLFAAARELFEVFQDGEAARIAGLLSRGSILGTVDKGETTCNTRIPNPALVQR
jgi:hypothetical protein